MLQGTLWNLQFLGKVEMSESKFVFLSDHREASFSLPSWCSLLVVISFIHLVLLVISVCLLCFVLFLVLWDQKKMLLCIICFVPYRIVWEHHVQIYWGLEKTKVDFILLCSYTEPAFNHGCRICDGFSHKSSDLILGRYQLGVLWLILTPSSRR